MGFPSIRSMGVSRTAATEINRICEEAFRGADNHGAALVQLPDDVNAEVASVASAALTDQSQRYERTTPEHQQFEIEKSKIKINSHLQGMGISAARTVDQMAIAVQHQAACSRAIYAQSLAVPVPSNPLAVANAQVKTTVAPPPAPTYADPVVIEGVELLNAQPVTPVAVGEAAAAV